MGNGFHEPRSVLTGAGPLELKKPRVRDKGAKGEDAIKFSSWILPRYLRRSKSIDELVPWLYLKGISTGDFPEALQALLGADAKGLSANVIVKLKDAWNDEFKAWQKRDLSQKEYVYVWADGIHCNVRLDDERQCLLVLMGATKDGTKELIAVHDGYRESEQSWKEVLVDLKAHGLKVAPKLATGDGALGFWAALRKVWPTTREQRLHRTPATTWLLMTPNAWSADCSRSRSWSRPGESTNANALVSTVFRRRSKASRTRRGI